MYSNMVDKVWNGISVQWSFYMKSGDGSVVVVKSEPQFTPEFDSVDMDDGEYCQIKQIFLSVHLSGVLLLAFSVV